MPHGSCCDSQRLVRENHGTALLQFGNSQRLCVKLSRLCFAANRSDLCAKLSPPGFCCNSQRLVLKLTARLCRNSATRKDFARSSPDWLCGDQQRLARETLTTRLLLQLAATCAHVRCGTHSSPRLVCGAPRHGFAATRRDLCVKFSFPFAAICSDLCVK